MKDTHQLNTPDKCATQNNAPRASRLAPRENVTLHLLESDLQINIQAAASVHEINSRNISMQSKPSTTSLRSAGVSQPSKIPRPSGGSQEYMRRVYRSLSFAQVMGTDGASDQTSDGGARRRRSIHSIDLRSAALGSHPPEDDIELLNLEAQGENRSTLPDHPKSPERVSASRASSSALPRASDFSDRSSADAVYGTPSEHALPHDTSFGGLSSLLADSEFSADQTAGSAEAALAARAAQAADDTEEVASFSTRHSPRQVQVHHGRQGMHERLESAEGGVGSQGSGVNVARSVEDEVAPAATPVRTRSQRTMIRSPPPPPKKSWVAKIFECFSCGGKA